MIATIICFFRGHHWVSVHRTVRHGWLHLERCARCKMERYPRE